MFGMWKSRAAAYAVGATALVLATLTGAATSASAPTRVPGAPTAQAPSVQAPTGIDEYVALGDSYTAGPLIPELDAALGCFRSTHNYPALLARALGVDTFSDVSCSGADTTDLTSPQHTGFARVPSQVSALSADTDLVTVGIGGNDFSVFGRLVGVCPAVRPQDPGGDPCRDHFGDDGRDALLSSLARTRDRLDDAVAEIVRRAPNAQVMVVGYPRIAPMQGTCPAVLPFADGDYRYANRVERRLNAALRHAARTNQVGYVDTYGPSRGHDVCAGRQAWVNGQFTNPQAAQAYHPFRSYMEAVADLVLAELSG